MRLPVASLIAVPVVLIVLGAFAFGGMVIGAGLSAAIRRAPQLDVVNRSPDLPER